MKKIIIISSIGLTMGITIFLVLFYNNRHKEIRMLDFKNSSLKEIKSFADKYDLDLNIEYTEDETVPKDKVISQSIKPDTFIKVKEGLKVVISKGPFDKSIYSQMKVNELGRIPIMMYHGIQNITDNKYAGGNIDAYGYQRTASSFRKDLEFYYQNNYRMIRLKDYVSGIIDVPLGKSPLVLTFDDGNANNIKVTGLNNQGQIIIDPNSAVGILEEYKQKYPDFQITATFFITSGLFNQPEYNDKIIKWLINHGYDVGNHTNGHVELGRISKEEVIKQIGKLYKKLNNIIPNQYVEIIALPYGSPYTSDHPNFLVIKQGTYEDLEYDNMAALRVGWDADYSPFSSNFNSQYMKRIRAYDNNGKDFDIEMNFRLLESNRYISDGDKNKIVVLNKDQSKLKETTLKVITY